MCQKLKLSLRFLSSAITNRVSEFLSEGLTKCKRWREAGLGSGDAVHLRAAVLDLLREGACAC